MLSESQEQNPDTRAGNYSTQQTAVVVAPSYLRTGIDYVGQIEQVCLRARAEPTTTQSCSLANRRGSKERKTTREPLTAVCTKLRSSGDVGSVGVLCACGNWNTEVLSYIRMRELVVKGRRSSHLGESKK